MTRRPHLSPTTHTVEMAQIEEINGRLTTRSPSVTASDLGLGDVALFRRHAATLPPDATLVRLTWQGSPEYPYVHGHFAADGSRRGSLEVEMHTDALQALCKLLSLHQSWGIGVVRRRSR